MTPRPHRLADFHWPLLFIVVTIALLGVYNLHSAAAARDPHLYLTQAYWFLFGLGLIGLVQVLDYRVLETLAYTVYGIACILLAAVLVQGELGGGARRWLSLGPVKFQPSELAKFATIICLARYFSQRPRDSGYSLAALFRPLNPSRPLVATVGLALSWSNPWLADPIGELARLIQASTDQEITVGNSLWFRMFAIGVLTMVSVGVVLTVVRWGRAKALLDPWPKGRRRKVIAMGLVPVLIAGGGLAFFWRSEILRDPIAVLIRHLARGALPGGQYHQMEPQIALRLFLVLLVIGYAFVALGSLRRQRQLALEVFIAPIDLLALPALLIMFEPDLGTAGSLILVGMTMIFVVGVRLRSLLWLAFLGAATAGAAWFGVLKDYQKRRILTFLDPEHDIKGAGWNAIQSMIAVGSGRWVGKGHRGGTQSQLSFLPEQHTDFAFSVWAEEQGFLGCALVILLYLVMCMLALSIAANAREAYGALVATGIGAMLIWHVLINIGMVVGMAPVVGLPLPLFSYGGSSLLTMMVAIGLLLNIHWRRRAF